MMNIFKSTGLLPAVALLALSTLGAGAQTFMTQKELLETLPGATITGVSARNGTAWIQVYSEGRRRGNIAGRFGEDEYSAKWYVRQNKWCEDWGSGKACWFVERLDAKTLQTYEEDGTRKNNPWTLR